ncbi:zinc ribbon domain-containing protein [Microcoleus vaginatus GB2-A3]|uniref:zinc ribbon domain-containing protein n=1 Tax=Microcoleus vaginatus TaxID=119532 RepID=UPI0032ABF0CA
MSSTVTCPYCSAETSSEYNFCTACELQIKCIDPNCNKMLIAGKAKCFGCGQAIAVTTNQPSSQLNKYVRDVKQNGENYEEHIELSVTDHAVSELAPFIGAEMMPRPSQKLHDPLSQKSSTIATQKTVSTNEIFTESQELPQLPANAADEVEDTQTGNDERSPYFEVDGEFLIATVKDFKGKTRADQQRYFILLYAAAYHRYFKKPVPSKEHFKTAAQKASVLDPTNFPKYLNQLTRKYLSQIGSGYKLNHDGEKEVKHIIVLMEDENVDAGFEYWTRSPSSGTKRPRLSNDDKNKVKEWAIEDVNMGELKVRDIKKARDYAMVSLWIIIHKLEKAKTVSCSQAYLFFKEKFETISVTSQAFRLAMSNSKNTNYFRPSGTQYFLTPEGERKVESWVAGEPLESGNDTEDETGN